MRTVPLYISLGLFKKSIVASHLDEREPQRDLSDWSIPGAIWSGGATAVGALGTLLDSQDWNLNTNPPPDTDTQPNPLIKDNPAPPLSPPLSGTSSPGEQVYKININNGPPTRNQDCDSLSIECGKTTDQLIFTSSCVGIDPNQVVSAGAIAQNQAIHDALLLMNGENVLAGTAGPGLRISTLKPCDVFFFAVPLTQQQIKDIEGKPGIEFVSPNQPLIEDILDSSDLDNSFPAVNPVLTAPVGQFKERDEIVEDRLAWEDLRHISTPENSQISSAYSYRSNAGDQVTIIAVDRGVDDKHLEFMTAAGENSLLEERIYAMDSVRPGYDTAFGTCHASKMVGRTVGVARKAKVLIAKIYTTLSSLVDVLARVFNYLSDKRLAGKNVQGYHVMSFMLVWDQQDEKITARFDELLDLLIKYLQLVVVVPAGNDDKNLNSPINQWPGMSSRRHDIIVVGAIDVKTGKTYPFSRGGPFLSLNAPGEVLCANVPNKDEISYVYRRGTSAAAGQVTGLIAYLLSLDDIGQTLRKDPVNIPATVKYYLQNTASKRVDDYFPAIWNLLPAVS